MIKSLLRHKLLKSTLIYTFGSAVNKAVPFLILPILSFYLLPEQFGIVANFNVLLAILVIFVNIGLDGAISARYFSMDKDELKIFVFNGLVLSFLAAALMLLIITASNRLIFDWFKIDFKYQILTVIAALFSVVTTLNLTLWRLEERPFQYGFYEISQTIVNILISLLLVIILKRGWTGRVDGILISTILYGVFSLFFLFKRNYLKFSISKSLIKAILLFGTPLVPHALSIWLRAGADRIIITRLVNEYYTGLYATGFQFGVFISFITMAFNNAFVPFLYKNLSETDTNILYKNKLKLVKLTYVCLIAYGLLTVFFSFFSDIIIRNLFSSKYLESKEFIVWAIISQAFQGFYLLFVNYLFFTNKTKLLATITISCSILQVGLSYALVGYLGAIGAAYSSVIISIINFVAIMFAAIKAIDMPWKYWIKNNENEK